MSKRNDGTTVLRCTRADGSATWQRQSGRNAMFFPLHDLTHFAVESTLATREGFFGLVADGWDIADTGGKGARGPLPAGAVCVEHVVGLVERGGIGRDPLSAAEINAQLDIALGAARLTTPRRLTDDEVAAIHRRAAELHERWAIVAPGDALRLELPS